MRQSQLRREPDVPTGWHPAAPPKLRLVVPGPPAGPVDENDAAMARYAAGEESAFARLCPAVRLKLQKFLARKCKDAELAEDLVQETLLRIYRARLTFRQGDAVMPWVYAIARNVHRDHIRGTATQRRSSNVDFSRRADVDSVLDDAPTAEETLLSKELAESVAHAMRSLSSVQCDAFLLLRIEGLSAKEAARRIGVTEMAVKLRAFRATEALRTALTRASPRLQRNERLVPSTERAGSDALAHPSARASSRRHDRAGIGRPSQIVYFVIEYENTPSTR